MSVSYLNLPPSALSAPSRTDLDLVSALMLWPDDGPMRERAIETSFVTLMHTVADQLSRGDLVELVSLAKDATPIDQIHQTTRQRMIDGARAGIYLRETVGHVSLHRNISMKALAAKVAAIPPKLNAHTFENTIWPRYRPVSHFWAAWLHLAEAISEQSKQAFPCGTDQLAHFLGLSEGVRQLGECTRTKQSPSMVLRSAEGVRVSPEMAIQPIAPDFDLRTAG
jgi:hypothetical protein